MVVAGTLNRNRDGGKAKSVATKIAMQMNCKMGGELWAVNIPVGYVNAY